MTTLRRAIAADGPQLLQLQRAYYYEDGYPFDEEEARHALAVLLSDVGLGQVWVADDDGRLVGYAALTFGYSLEYRGRDAFVDEIYIGESQRGRGFGRAALRRLEAACREAGVRAMHLEVERGKPGARSLYTAEGYRDGDRYLLTKMLD